MAARESERGGFDACSSSFLIASTQAPLNRGLPWPPPHPLSPARTPAGRSWPLSMVREQGTTAGSGSTAEELLATALLVNTS